MKKKKETSFGGGINSNLWGQCEWIIEKNNKCKEGAKKLVSFCAYVGVSVQQWKEKVIERERERLLLCVPIHNPNFYRPKYIINLYH